jgi:hypothetical protein
MRDFRFRRSVLMKTDSSTSSFITVLTAMVKKMQKPTKDKDCVKTAIETNEYEHKRSDRPSSKQPRASQQRG